VDPLSDVMTRRDADKKVMMSKYLDQVAHQRRLFFSPPLLFSFQSFYTFLSLGNIALSLAKQEQDFT